MKYDQSNEDLQRHLNDCREFLLRSCSAFDQGFESESKRLSVTLRLLLHETKYSTSLAKQVHVDTMQFMDTASENFSANIDIEANLTIMRVTVGRGVEYLPRLLGPPPRDPPKWKPFADWWAQVVLSKGQQSRFTRRDLVLHVANTDGGAHVDPSIDELYAKISRDPRPIVVFMHGSQQLHLLNQPVYASIRQIAHEVLQSLERELGSPQTTPS